MWITRIIYVSSSSGLLYQPPNQSPSFFCGPPILQVVKLQLQWNPSSSLWTTRAYLFCPQQLLQTHLKSLLLPCSLLSTICVTPAADTPHLSLPKGLCSCSSQGHFLRNWLTWLWRLTGSQICWIGEQAGDSGKTGSLRSKADHWQVSSLLIHLLVCDLTFNFLAHFEALKFYTSVRLSLAVFPLWLLLVA